MTASPLNVSISFAAIVDAGDEEQVCLFLAEMDFPTRNRKPCPGGCIAEHGRASRSRLPAGRNSTRPVTCHIAGGVRRVRCSRLAW